MSRGRHRRAGPATSSDLETFEQVEYLRMKGITVAQGYIFAPPLPGGSYAALLEAAEKPEVKAEGEDTLLVRVSESA